MRTYNLRCNALTYHHPSPHSALPEQELPCISDAAKLVCEELKRVYPGCEKRGLYIRDLESCTECDDLEEHYHVSCIGTMALILMRHYPLEPRSVEHHISCLLVCRLL